MPLVVWRIQFWRSLCYVWKEQFFYSATHRAPRLRFKTKANLIKCARNTVESTCVSRNFENNVFKLWIKLMKRETRKNVSVARSRCILASLHIRAWRVRVPPSADTCVFELDETIMLTGLYVSYTFENKLCDTTYLTDNTLEREQIRVILLVHSIIWCIIWWLSSSLLLSLGFAS